MLVAAVVMEASVGWSAVAITNMPKVAKRSHLPLDLHVRDAEIEAEAD